MEDTHCLPSVCCNADVLIQDLLQTGGLTWLYSGGVTWSEMSGYQFRRRTKHPRWGRGGWGRARWGRDGWGRGGTG